MSRRQRRIKTRSAEGFNLSFLDVICCGFGAVILLLVLSRFAEPVTIEEKREDLNKQIIAMTEQIVLLTGETPILNKTVVQLQEQLAVEQAKLARLRGLLAKIKGEAKTSGQDTQVSKIIETELLRAKQSLTAEMKRLQSQDKGSRAVGNIGGLQVDSEYIIFIIDTSGSMLNYSWKLMLTKVEETLAIYPRVKGIQVMNDMGQYLFSQYRGEMDS